MEPSNEFEGKYITLPQSLIVKKGLTLLQKLLLIQIHNLDNDKGCFASNEYLSRFFGVSTRWIRGQLSVLKEKGYLKIKVDRKLGDRSIKMTRKGVKYLVSISQIPREEQSFRKGRNDRSGEGGTIVPKGEEQSFQKGRNDRSSIKEKDKIKDKNKVTKKGERDSEIQYSKKSQLQKLQEPHGQEYVEFCALFEIPHTKENGPLMNAWREAGPEEWQAILDHAKKYVVSNDRRYLKSGLKYLEKKEWINNPNPVCRLDSKRKNSGQKEKVTPAPHSLADALRMN